MAGCCSGSSSSVWAVVGAAAGLAAVAGFFAGARATGEAGGGASGVLVSAAAAEADPIAEMKERAKKAAEQAKQDAEKAVKDAMGADPMAGMSGEDMMKMMEEANQPNEHHKMLNAFTGTWDAVMTMNMPTGEVMASKGKAVNEMMFGGRFSKTTFTGEFLGKPFFGEGWTGYSNAEKTYQTTWVDSVSTSLYFMTGTASADGKTMTFDGTELDPMSGAKMPVRDIITIESPDQHTMARMMTLPDGTSVPSFKIVYTRAK